MSRPAANGELAFAVETIQLAGGGRYVGQINSDREPHGSGIEFRADGNEESRGQWRNGELHGHGRVRLPNGDRYEGDFVDGLFSGLGRYTHSDGRMYEGELADNQANGFGAQWNKDARMLWCGHWANDVLMESCAVSPSKFPTAKLADLICPDGGFYCGAVDLNHQPHGVGSLHRADGGEAVRGDWIGGRLWVSGARDAQGRLQGVGCEWSVLGMYEGTFKSGSWHGLGALMRLDGSGYEGEWAEEKAKGFGACWDATGKVVECGRWANDHLVEEWPVPRFKMPFGAFLSASAKAAPPERTLLLPGGGYYVGDFNADRQQEGKGAVYHSDGITVASGHWSNGQLHGFGVKWNKDGGLKECGRFEGGELIESRPVPLRKVPAGVVQNENAKGADPKRTLLLPNGGHYVGGLNADQRQDGKGVAFHANGKFAVSGHWLNGKLHGLAVTWDESEKMKECGRFERGTLKKKCAVPRIQLPVDLANNYGGADLLLPDGGRYVGQLNERDQQHGQGVKFKTDGAESASGQWRDGKLHGRGYKIYSNGDRYEGEFVNGEMRGVGAYTWTDGDVYEGEIRRILHGFGIRWNAEGRMKECGRWSGGKLVESRSVPRSKLPVGTIRNAAANDAALLFPDGGFYRGEINEKFQRHGKGSMHSEDGVQLERGVWLDDVQQPTRKALLIGNNDYLAPQQPLYCCRNDAEDMRDALVQLGFACTLLLDPTRRQMTDSIHIFIESLRPDDIVFIYFSGHGEESHGRTYLLPVDFGRGQLRDHAVCLEELQHDLNEKNCNLINIVMLDCCRYDKADRTFKSGVHSRANSNGTPRSGDSFARKPTSGQFLVAYSSDRGTSAYESSEERNGYFTACVLNHLAVPGLMVEQIFKRANKDLKAKSDHTQRSWIHLTMDDDVVLCERI